MVDGERALNEIITLLISVGAGAIVGFEREYRSKPAGFRTMILVSLGSTLFTMASIKMGSSSAHDRIAANIITGIGFLGAGVIYKDGLNVGGLTTAVTIWAVAALGMMIGIGEYHLVVFSLIVILIILSLLETVQLKIDKMHQRRRYSFKIDKSKNPLSAIENKFSELKIDFKNIKTTWNETEITIIYDLMASRQKLEKFDLFIEIHPDIKEIEQTGF